MTDTSPALWISRRGLALSLLLLTPAIAGCDRGESKDPAPADEPEGSAKPSADEPKEEHIGDDADEPAGAVEDAPVSLSKLKLSFAEPSGLSTKGRTKVKLSADVKTDGKAEGILQVKVACEADGDVYVDDTWLHREGGSMGFWKVEELKSGDTASVTGSVFRAAGLPGEPTRCQLEVGLGSLQSIKRVGSWCYDGSSSREGECPGGLTAKNKGSAPLGAHGVEVFVADGYDLSMAKLATPKEIHGWYAVRVGERFKPARGVVGEQLRCKVGDRVWATGGSAGKPLPLVPFPVEAGESILYRVSDFDFPLPAAPQWCEVDVVKIPLSGGKESIGGFCWKPGAAATAGPCEPPSSEAPKPPSSSSLAFDHVRWRWKELSEDATHHSLELEFQATLAGPVEGDGEGLAWTAECDSKPDDGTHVSQLALDGLKRGDVIRFGGTAFRRPIASMDADSCEIRIRHDNSKESAPELASFCIRGDTLTQGRCPGATKGSAAAVETIYASDMNGSNSGGSTSTPVKEVVAPPAADLPERISSSDVRDGIRKVLPQLQACARKHSAKGKTIKIKMTISGSLGRAVGISTPGDDSGTELGKCVRTAVVGARFKKFQRKDMKITYPIKL